MNLEAEKVMHIRASCAEALKVGDTACGKLGVIPIIGGDFTGKNICGTVVPGGADWNTAMEDGISHLFAKYMLKTDDGEYIAIENSGIVDFKNGNNRIKTHPVFSANKSGKYDWLNTGVFVGELEPSKDTAYAVEIIIYKML